MINIKFFLPLFILFSFRTVGQVKDINESTSLKMAHNFNYDKAVFKFNEEQMNNTQRFLRFSAITNYKEGIDPVKGKGHYNTYIDLQHGTYRFYMINLSIQDMLTMGFVKQNRVLLEVHDISKYRYDKSLGDKLEWMRKNAYCFEYLMPYGTIKNMKSIKNELSHYFNVTFGNEKRVVDALILFKTSDKDKIKSKGIGEGYYDDNGHFNNLPIDALTQLIERKTTFPPIIDETGYTGNVDLEIGSNLDFLNLRKFLSKYDLDLKLEKREIEMFVIRENNIRK